MTEGEVRCRYCDASTKDTTEHAIQKMSKCNNCRADIALTGQWTGVGHKILQALRDRLRSGEGEGA